MYQQHVLSLLCLLLAVEAGLNELCEMITFYRKLPVTAECLEYDDYGCWCGPGGSGTPVDKTDACCKVHDKCYDKIIASKECSPYFKQYMHVNGTCHDAKGSCPYNTCLCDKNLAMCLSGAEYNWRYWGYRFRPGTCKN